MTIFLCNSYTSQTISDESEFPYAIANPLEACNDYLKNNNFTDLKTLRQKLSDFNNIMNRNLGQKSSKEELNNITKSIIDEINEMIGNAVNVLTAFSDQSIRIHGYYYSGTLIVQTGLEMEDAKKEYRMLDNAILKLTTLKQYFADEDDLKLQGSKDAYSALTLAISDVKSNVAKIKNRIGKYNS